MKKIFFTIVISVSVLMFSGCAPRGETITLDEVFEKAKSRLINAELEQDGELPEAVANLKMTLDRVLATSESGTQGSARVYVDTSETIDVLIPRAGVTSRAALNQLSRQFRSLADQHHVTADQAKLIVARTYNAVASELETTKFGL